MINATIQLYKQAYSGLTRNIWLLSTVMLINRSGTMVLAFLTLYNKELGYTIEQGGWIVAIYGVGAFAGAFIGGKLSDAFGFYKIQFGALFFGGIMFILLGQMNSYGSICICTFFLSMINESFRPANASAIAHYSNPQNRTQSFSLIRLAINLGWGVGIAVGGFLASFNYHLLFWVDGGTNISAALLLLLILPKISLEQQKKQGKDNAVIGKTISSAFKDSTFLFFLAFIILFASSFFQLFTTVPIFFHENLHLNEFWIGVVMAINGLLIAVFEMLIVFKLEGRKPYLFFITVGTALMGVAFLLLNIPFAQGFMVAMMAVLMLTIAEMISMPFMNSYYISKTNEQNRGEYAAMYTMAWSAAQIIGSSTGSIIAHQLGFFYLWCITAGTCLIAAAGFYWLLHKKKTIAIN
jgi:predicted MFS family arabinose efflux permease